MYVPFTGLGLYGGSRGKRWLRNRIQIFKQFVVPSLLAQTSQNFTVWVSWRKEDKGNKDILELKSYLESMFGTARVVFTYTGVCFYDDKYPDAIARDRLIMAIQGATGVLVNYIGDVKDVIYTIQPSDDCYHTGAVQEIQELFKNTGFNAIGYQHGYIMAYQTGELREYNPKTNPPFYSIRMPKDIFLDPFKHAHTTALKRDVGQYKQGTPCPSHEYIGDCMNYLQLPKRGFLVGTHGENISTHINNPYAGDTVDKTVLDQFGIMHVPLLSLKNSWRKNIMKKLPYKVQRKLRYIFGEKIYQKIYQTING